jgi:hypothetical protein
MKPPKGDILLSRSQFSEGTQERDGHKCVRCGRTATPDGRIKLDSHHIMERRLWTHPRQFGGYFLDNGATLCDTAYDKLDGVWSCHLMAGMTLISPDEVRQMAGIQKVLLPEDIYGDSPLTVWGDPVMPNGKRMRGPLFQDESVQKMLQLGGVLDLYTKYVRHPRTPHHPLSPKALSKNMGDDTVMPDWMVGNRPITTTTCTCGHRISRAIRGRIGCKTSAPRFAPIFIADGEL